MANEMPKRQLALSIADTREIDDTCAATVSRW